MRKKEYVEDFLNGNLYMNTLYNFGEKIFEDARRKREAYIISHPEENPDDVKIAITDKLSGAQSDMLEGFIGYGSNARLKSIFGENLLSNYIYQAIGFQYCNVLCFYRLDYVSDGVELYYNIPNMGELCKGFGQFVIIIKNKQELLRRIDRAVKDMKYFYRCGDVEYKALIKNGTIADIAGRHNVLVKQEPVVNIKEMQLEYGDCFTKFDKYAVQREWRLALYRGQKDTDAFWLRIGNIRDIAYSTTTEELISELAKMVHDGDIKQSRDESHGNISRTQMRRKFYRLGGNKANVFLLIG